MSELGCCWNSSLSSENATQCYGIANNQTSNNLTQTTRVPMTTTKNPSTKEFLSTTAGPTGTCQVYRDRPLCDTWLNVTMLEYRWTPRYTDNRFGVNGTEAMIGAFMYFIDRIDGQEKCKNILRPLVCEYFLPPCNENNEPYSYCREDCEALFDECDLAMREILGAAKYFHKEPGKDLAHASMPNCAKLPYSADSRPGRLTCVHFGLLNFTSAKPSMQQRTESSKNFSATAISATIAGAVTLLAIIIIIARIFKRRKRNLPTLPKDIKSKSVLDPYANI